MKKWVNTWLLLLLISLLLDGCNASAPQSPLLVPSDPPDWPTHGWRTSTPEQQGMDSEKLAQMLVEIQADGIRVHSVLIVRNGYLLAEVYYDPYRPEMKHQIASITKSVIGALTGIAIEQGSIQNIHQK